MSLFQYRKKIQYQLNSSVAEQKKRRHPLPTVIPFSLLLSVAAYRDPLIRSTVIYHVIRARTRGGRLEHAAEIDCIAVGNATSTQLKLFFSSVPSYIRGRVVAQCAATNSDVISFTCDVAHLSGIVNAWRNFSGSSVRRSVEK